MNPTSGPPIQDPTEGIRIGNALYLHKTGDIAAFSIILTYAADTPELVELHRITGSHGGPILEGLQDTFYPVAVPSEEYWDQIPDYLKDCINIPIILTTMYRLCTHFCPYPL